MPGYRTMAAATTLALSFALLGVLLSEAAGRSSSGQPGSISESAAVPLLSSTTPLSTVPPSTGSTTTSSPPPTIGTAPPTDVGSTFTATSIRATTASVPVSTATSASVDTPTTTPTIPPPSGTSATLAGVTELARPPDETATAGVTGSAVLVGTEVHRAGGAPIWADPAHPVNALENHVSGAAWAVTSTGAILFATANSDTMILVSEPTGLSYTTMALTDAHVVVGTGSGAVLAFGQPDPSEPRVLASPLGPDGLALPVTQMAATGGERLRVVADGHVFLLTTDPDGVAVDCGPITAPSC